MSQRRNDYPLLRDIAIVGSGMAGLTLAHHYSSEGQSVDVFEKSRGPGGRLASRRVDHGGLDIGAQYFTIRDPDFHGFLTGNAGSGAWQRWNGRLIHDGPQGPEPFHAAARYVGTPRMTAVSRALSQGLNCRFESRVTGVERDDSGWWLTIEGSGVIGPYRTMVVTTPPQQARALLGDTPAGKDPVMDERPLDACWALALHFPEPLGLPYEGRSFQKSTLQWIANNSSKPGRDMPGEWWVLHASPEWSETHRHTDREAVAGELEKAFMDLTGASVTPDRWIAHRWLYARNRCTDSGPGYRWYPEVQLGLCGDWLTSGRVEGAWRSAMSLARAMAGD